MSKSSVALKHYQMYINGEFKDSSSGNLITVLNPATGEPISTVPSATLDECREAIDAAYEAQKSWKKVPAATRGQYLHDVATEIRKDSAHLIAIFFRLATSVKSPTLSVICLIRLILRR